MFSFLDHVEVPKHVLVRFLGKETVLLNLEAECYYGLDEIGTRMWQVRHQDSRPIETAYVELLNEFEVEAEQLRQDLSEFLGRLMR